MIGVLAPPKKLNLKNARCIHIQNDGSLFIMYSERHKTSGKDISWDEIVPPHEVPFKIVMAQPRENFVYRSICIFDRIVPLMNDVVRVEIWPKNNGDDTAHKLKTIVFELKNKASVCFNEYTVNGNLLGSHDVKFTH